MEWRHYIFRHLGAHDPIGLWYLSSPGEPGLQQFRMGGVGVFLDSGLFFPVRDFRVRGEYLVALF